MGWTIAVSWGPSGGFYVFKKNGWPRRLCLWRLALTFVPVEVDELMESYAKEKCEFRHGSSGVPK